MYSYQEMIRWIYLQCLVVGLASVGSIARVLVLGRGSGLSSRLWCAGGSTIECSCLVAVLCRLGELSWLRSWLRSCTSSRHRRLLVTHNQINDRVKRGCHLDKRLVFFLPGCVTITASHLYRLSWNLESTHSVQRGSNVGFLHFPHGSKCLPFCGSFLQWKSKVLTDSHEIWIL